MKMSTGSTRGAVTASSIVAGQNAYAQALKKPPTAASASLACDSLRTVDECLREVSRYYVQAPKGSKPLRGKPVPENVPGTLRFDLPKLKKAREPYAFDGLGMPFTKTPLGGLVLFAVLVGAGIWVSKHA